MNLLRQRQGSRLRRDAAVTKRADPTTDQHTAGRFVLTRLWDGRWCYLFALPALVLAGLFTFYPMVYSWYIALFDWPGFGGEQVFIGLGNFREVVRDEVFWAAFGRSLLFVAVSVPIKLLLGLIFAIVLNDQTIRLRSVIRTFIFLPVVTTTAIVGIVMSLILSPFDGPLNALLVKTDLVDAPIDFLGNADLALWSVTGVQVWKGVGLSMMYWLVALQNVPDELYEVARVDGASTWRMHLHITVPLIVPFGAIIFLITTAGALQAFALVQAMTGGGPYFSTELVELYIYRLAFEGEGTTQRLGYASAVAVFFGITVSAVALLQAWVARRTRIYRRGVAEAKA